MGEPSVMGQSQPQPHGCGGTPSMVRERVHSHTKRGPCLGEIGNVMGCRKRVFCDSTRIVIGCGREKAVAEKGIGLSDLRRNKNCEIEGSGAGKACLSYHTIHSLGVFLLCDTVASRAHLSRCQKLGWE